VAVEITARTESYFFAGEAMDISEGGVFVVTPEIKPIGSIVMLEIKLLDRNVSVSTQGIVRWIRDASTSEGAPLGIEGAVHPSLGVRHGVEKTGGAHIDREHLPAHEIPHGGGLALQANAELSANEAARAVRIPIMGLGGVTTAEDAAEFLLAGATAVQIGTASYADPRAVQRIADSLEKWCARHHIAKVKDLIGAVQVNE